MKDSASWSHITVLCPSCVPRTRATLAGVAEHSHRAHHCNRCHLLKRRAQGGVPQPGDPPSGHTPLRTRRCVQPGASCLQVVQHVPSGGWAGSKAHREQSPETTTVRTAPQPCRPLTRPELRDRAILVSTRDWFHLPPNSPTAKVFPNTVAVFGY